MPIKPETIALRNEAKTSTDENRLLEIFRENPKNPMIIWCLAKNPNCPTDILYTIAKDYKIICPAGADAARWHDSWNSQPLSKHPWSG